MIILGSYICTWNMCTYIHYSCFKIDMYQLTHNVPHLEYTWMILDMHYLVHDNYISRYIQIIHTYNNDK